MVGLWVALMDCQLGRTMVGLMVYWLAVLLADLTVDRRGVKWDWSSDYS